MEVQQLGGQRLAEAGTLFGQRLFPRLIGSQPSGTADPVGIVEGDLLVEERIGLVVIPDALVGQQADQPALEVAEAALDLALGGCVRGDAMGDAQGGEGTLELGMSIESIRGRGVAEKGEAIGVHGRRGPRLLEGWAQQTEVIPGGIGGECAGHDAAGMVVDGQQEHLILAAWPPGVGRGVMLVEFPDVGALPAPAGLGPGRRSREEEPGQTNAQMGRQGRARSDEAEPPGQFVGHEGEVQRPTGRHELAQEVLHLAGPSLAVVATGGSGPEPLGGFEPLVPKGVELGTADLQTLGRGGRVEGSTIELPENVGDVGRGQAPGELGLFMGRRIGLGGSAPKPPEFIALDQG